jgi:hypothetical protein
MRWLPAKRADKLQAALVRPGIKAIDPFRKKVSSLQLWTAKQALSIAA